MLCPPRLTLVEAGSKDADESKGIDSAEIPSTREKIPTSIPRPERSRKAGLGLLFLKLSSDVSTC